MHGTPQTRQAKAKHYDKAKPWVAPNKRRYADLRAATQAGWRQSDLSFDDPHCIPGAPTSIADRVHFPFIAPDGSRHDHLGGDLDAGWSVDEAGWQRQMARDARLRPARLTVSAGPSISLGWRPEGTLGWRPE